MGINWSQLIEAGVMSGMAVPTILSVTLPELWLTMRGWQRGQGIDPDEGLRSNLQPMSKIRLMELAERFG